MSVIARVYYHGFHADPHGNSNKNIQFGIFALWKRTTFNERTPKISTDLKTNSTTHAKTPQTCYSLLHLQALYRYDIVAVSGCCRLRTVQNWWYQTGTVCWFASAVSVWCNRMIQVCWEQTVAVCKNRHDGPTALHGSCFYQINQDWWIQMIRHQYWYRLWPS